MRIAKNLGKTPPGVYKLVYCIGRLAVCPYLCSRN
jgi:hypothetical protein